MVIIVILSDQGKTGPPPRDSHCTGTATVEWSPTRRSRNRLPGSSAGPVDRPANTRVQRQEKHSREGQQYERNQPGKPSRKPHGPHAFLLPGPLSGRSNPALACGLFVVSGRRPGRECSARNRVTTASLPRPPERLRGTDSGGHNEPAISSANNSSIGSAGRSRADRRTCLRTSHATWLKMAGADVKDAQAQMRHSRSSTTLDIYQQFVPESQQRAVEKLSSLSKRVQELDP